MEYDYPSETDLFRAENERWSKIENHVQKLYELKYFDPIQDIYEKIEDIITNPYFCLALEYENQETVFEDNYYCISCGASIPIDIMASPEIQNATVENIKHLPNCQLEKLRSLANTLGDMIA